MTARGLSRLIDVELSLDLEMCQSLLGEETGELFFARLGKGLLYAASYIDGEETKKLLSYIDGEGE